MGFVDVHWVNCPIWGWNNSALNMYNTLLSDTFFKLLATERDELIAFFKLEHMKNGIR